jgi:toxin ParE1/3/4
MELGRVLERAAALGLSRQLNISLTAEAEIAGIWEYTAIEHGFDAADDYAADLDTVMRRLLTYPYLGEDCSVIRQGYRRIRAREHVIYYRPFETSIEIMRVMHPRQDVRRRIWE